MPSAMRLAAIATAARCSTPLVRGTRPGEKPSARGMRSDCIVFGVATVRENRP